MIFNGYDLLFIFVLTAFLGFEVVSKVPSILHTPLMSGSNAIHGIILVGAMGLAYESHGALQLSLSFVAVFLATLNIVGGVVVTDRMLEMFKGRSANKPGGGAGGPTGKGSGPAGPSSTGPSSTGPSSTGPASGGGA